MDYLIIISVLFFYASCQSKGVKQDTPPIDVTELTKNQPEVHGTLVKEGEIVFASSHPMLALTVISIIEGHYHCRVQAEPTRQELVYLESDLSSFSTVEVAAEEVGGSC